MLTNGFPYIWMRLTFDFNRNMVWCSHDFDIGPFFVSVAAFRLRQDAYRGEEFPQI